MRKKALSMILAATVCLQLVGCGGSSTSSQSNGGDTTAADSGSDQADTQAEKEDSAASSSEGGSDEPADGGSFGDCGVNELVDMMTVSGKREPGR